VTNSQDDTVLQIDPRSRAVLQRIHLQKGTSPTGVAVGAGAVWATESLAGKVAKIDPSSGKISTIPLLRGQPSAVAFGDGFVWVVASADDSLTQIDPATDQVKNTISNVGDGPTGLAVANGVVYVTNANSGTVARVSVADHKIIGTSQLPRELSPDGVAVTGNTVWVALHAP
jgi:YVTN family beta-propeller protein